PPGSPPLPYPTLFRSDEGGRAQVRVTVPEIEGLGSTAERWRLEIEDEVTGVLWFDVFLAAQEEPTPTPTEEPTPTPTEAPTTPRSEEHTSELQSRENL